MFKFGFIGALGAVCTGVKGAALSALTRGCGRKKIEMHQYKFK